MEVPTSSRRHVGRGLCADRAGICETVSRESRIMKLSVISPTLNEAENVPRLVEQIERALGDIDFEILIVDDDSPDQTWSIAQKLSLTHPRVRVLRRTQNRGLGMAVIDGFSHAGGDVLACIDADLQHDPSILPRMLEELLRGSDVVGGRRYIEGGRAGKWGRLG